MAASPHPSFAPPDDLNARIWRYVDLPKLTSFLWTRSLHLSRLSDLPDKYEGHLPAHAIRRVNEEFAAMERLCGREPHPPIEYAQEAVDWVRASVYVNCWCCHPHESEALWRLYTLPSGAAISTTFSKLANALPPECHIGCVRYLDYDADAPDADNFYNLAAHKRVFFSHEREVRVASVVPRMRRQPEQPPSTPPFMTYPVEFAAFDAIYMSPYSPDWFFPLVADLLKRYDCSIPLLRSRMRPHPPETSS